MSEVDKIGELVSKERYVLVLLIISTVTLGLTYHNLPGPFMEVRPQTANDVLFNFAEYPVLTREQIAVFNYLHTLVDQPLDEWEGWYIRPDLYSLVHYHLAFMTYSLARMFEVTSGYRTDYYSDLLHTLILKMNTTEEVYGGTSVESMEWLRPSIGYANWTQYYYPNATDDSGVYTGGFRGPANIMWTAHYALMELLYERSFGGGLFFDEYTWYLEDWNTSLTTDGFGNPQEGGIWECGLIPCQPYEVWTQCNSVPILFTELYDNMYGTDYMPIWDHGLDFINNVMVDDHGLYTDGYFVQEPAGYVHTNLEVQQQFPGLQLDPYIPDGRPYVSSYGIAWTLLFLEYTQPERTHNDYPKFLEVYGRDISGEQMYIIDSYNNPSGFGTYDILANLYTVALALQQVDFLTRDRIMNFLWGPYNKVWSQDLRQMHWDTQSIEPFLESALAYGYLWATVGFNMKHLAEPRPTGFFNWPYISAADDDNLWVFQARWDPAKQGFILNIEVERESTLTFSNFNSTPRAWAYDEVLVELVPSGGSHTLTLSPGVYQLVIMQDV